MTPGTEDVGLAKGVSAIEPGTSVEHVGPEHGYKVRLPDGVELRLRHVMVNGVLHTQHRISGRWALPSAHDALVRGVRRVVQFFQSKPYHTIPFESSARELPARRAVGTVPTRLHLEEKKEPMKPSTVLQPVRLAFVLLSCASCASDELQDGQL